MVRAEPAETLPAMKADSHARHRCVSVCVCRDAEEYLMDGKIRYRGRKFGWMLPWGVLPNISSLNVEKVIKP